MAAPWESFLQGRKAVVIDSLERFFGPRAADPIDYIDQNWAARSGRVGAMELTSRPASGRSSDWRFVVPAD